VLGGGVGLATGVVVALFPFAAIGGGLLAATVGGGAVLGAVAGHVVAGMRRSDLKELGEHLDSGQAGLVVVGVSDMGAKIERAMHHAEKLEARELKADTAEIEADAKAAGADRCAWSPPPAGSPATTPPVLLRPRPPPPRRAGPRPRRPRPVPTIVSDLKRIDTAWTALQQQIDQDCGWKTAAQSPSHSSLHCTFPRRSPVGR
jgi:hypothetical protein